MAILSQLSSQVGDRTEAANRSVVQQCLDDPTLLDEIAVGLRSENEALAGDCAEVMTKVAEQQPALVAPYALSLSSLLQHKAARARWEAMHALSLVARDVPERIASMLPALLAIIGGDPSVIARDYAVDTVGNYAASGPAAAQQAYPILIDALAAWDGKQAGHALNGLAKVAMFVPELREEIGRIGVDYTKHHRGVVRKAARDLLKAIKNL